MSTNILDEKILKTQAFSFIHEFLADILNVFPEYKDKLVEAYNPFLSRQQDRIQGDNQEKCDIAMEFLNNISKYNKEIADKNDSLFENDIYLLHKVNFKEIWESKISDNTRTKIWNYLQTFSMLSITINSNKDLKKIMNSLDNIVKGDASENDNNELNAVLQNLRKLSTSLTKKDDDEGIATTEHLKNTEPVEKHFNNLFNGSKIGDLAKEIASDLNIENIVKENRDKPEDLLKNLFSGDNKDGKGFNIMNVVENISNKINKKITDGDLKEDDLMNEAKNMMANMDSNSLFGNLFNKDGDKSKADNGGMPDISNMLSMLGNMGNQDGNTGVPDISSMLNMMGSMGQSEQPNTSDSNCHSNDKVKQRLQRKLKDRHKK